MVTIYEFAKEVELKPLPLCAGLNALYVRRVKIRRANVRLTKRI
jgi:hypothetical protein